MVVNDTLEPFNELRGRGSESKELIIYSYSRRGLQWNNLSRRKRGTRGRVSVERRREIFIGGKTDNPSLGAVRNRSSGSTGS